MVHNFCGYDLQLGPMRVFISFFKRGPEFGCDTVNRVVLPILEDQGLNPVLGNYYLLFSRCV